MKLLKGFTLLELMITLAVAGVLLAVAAPSFVTMIKNNRVTTLTNDLLSDLALARGEAAKRGQSVAICISSNGTSCTGTDWLGGRIVFSDAGTAGTIDGTDMILRVSAAATSGLTLTSSNFANATYIRYGATGTASTGSGNLGTFKICDDRSGNYGKSVTITNTGRPTTQTVTCP